MSFSEGGGHIARDVPGNSSASGGRQRGHFSAFASPICSLHEYFGRHDRSFYHAFVGWMTIVYHFDVLLINGITHRDFIWRRFQLGAELPLSVLSAVRADRLYCRHDRRWARKLHDCDIGHSSK